MKNDSLRDEAASSQINEIFKKMYGENVSVTFLRRHFQT